jgi:hypothetical protein
MRRWFPLLILAAAQFVMVLDSSVMNVSISQIVADLDGAFRFKTRAGSVGKWAYSAERLSDGAKPT